MDNTEGKHLLLNTSHKSRSACPATKEYIIQQYCKQVRFVSAKLTEDLFCEKDILSFLPLGYVVLLSFCLYIGTYCINPGLTLSFSNALWLMELIEETSNTDPLHETEDPEHSAAFIAAVLPITVFFRFPECTFYKRFQEGGWMLPPPKCCTIMRQDFYKVVSAVFFFTHNVLFCFLLLFFLCVLCSEPWSSLEIYQEFFDEKARKRSICFTTCPPSLTFSEMFSCEETLVIL